MAKDFTYEIVALQEARHRMQEAKRRIKSEEDFEARKRAQIAIAERSQDAEIEFARALALANSQGVPQALIRSEVLRTNVWSRWTYWRDLAGIEPDRISVSNARESRILAASPFVWAEDYSTLTVRRNSKGADIEPLVYDMSTNQKVPPGIWWPDAHDIETERTVITADSGYLKFLSAEIEDKIEKGVIE